MSTHFVIFENLEMLYFELNSCQTIREFLALFAVSQNQHQRLNSVSVDVVFKTMNTYRTALFKSQRPIDTMLNFVDV